MSNNVENTSETRREDWETPQWLFDYLNFGFDFKIDLAANEENNKCDLFISEEQNTLKMTPEKIYCDFGVNVYKEFCWCNPPYGRQINSAWVKKLMEFPNIVVLHQASVGAKWFQPIWDNADLVVFPPYRLRFSGAPCKAQFDSCLIIRSNQPLYSMASFLLSIGNVVSEHDGIWCWDRTRLDKEK